MRMIYLSGCLSNIRHSRMSLMYRTSHWVLPYGIYQKMSYRKSYYFYLSKLMTYWKQNTVWNKKQKTKVQTSPIDRDENRAWGWFSKYVRLRDCLRTTWNPEVFKCCSCGCLTHFTKWDAGHFISRSYTTTKFDERNVYAQCQKCNRFQQWCWDKMYEYILKLHGKATIDELMDKKNEIAKYIDYSKLSDKYRELFNSLSKNQWKF